MFSLQSEQSGVPPQSITFSRGKTRLLYIDLQCYARTSGAAAHGHRFSTSADTPLTVRFTAITSKLTSSFFYKAFPHLIYGLLRVNKVTVCNQSGAQRATTRIDRGGTPPVRFTAIAQKFTSSFFYKAFPHLIYGLLRVNKVTVCNQSGAQRATTRIDRGGTPPRIGTGSLPAVHGNQFSKIINSEMVILTPITINNHFNNANYVTKVDHLCS